MADDAVRVFISYSHRDETLRHQLDKHLAPLKGQKVIEAWHDRQIPAGTEWANQIDDNLNRADIILLLVSPDFVASDYCFKIELDQAIKRHEAGEAIVVPVILEPCDWSWLPFAKFQAFPKDAKAISTWQNSNEAFLDVATGIRKVAQELFAKRKVLAEQKQANRERYLQKVEEVLSDGVISIVERDTLDELRETLGLTPAEATEIETRAYEPYSRVEENLNKYKQTLNRLIEKGYYPFSEEIEKDLENRQRDLGLKPEDAARISKPILDQAELDYQTKKKQLTEAEKLQALERQRQQEQEEYEAKLERYRQEFSKAVQTEYPLNEHVVEGLRHFRQQLGLRTEDFAQIERSIREPAESKYQEKLKQQAEAERQRQIEQEQRRQTEEQRKQVEAQKAQPSLTPPKSVQTQPATSQPVEGISIQTSDFETATLTMIEKSGWFGSKNSVEIRRSRGRARYFTENLGNDVTLETVEIPAGEFLMGEADTEKSAQHRVQVPAFWMGRFTVTQAQWSRVAGLPKVKRDLNPDPSNFKGSKRPVETVSWEEAVEFCDRLSRKTGNTYRLPSEAEWEYACRAGTTTPFHFGATITSDLVNCNGTNPYGNAPRGEYRQQTTDVGTFPPNGFGLFDMHGNVFEWCADPWHNNYQGAPTDGSVWVTNENDKIRIIRGGSWRTSPVYCRSAYRSSRNPHETDSYIGFRVVCSSPKTIT